MLVPRLTLKNSTQIDENFAVFHFHGIGSQIDANRRALGLPSAVVETPIMFGAFDDIANHQTAGEVNRFMCAFAIGRVILITGRTVDGESAALVIEAENIFEFNFVGIANR